MSNRVDLCNSTYGNFKPLFDEDQAAGMLTWPHSGFRRDPRAAALLATLREPQP